MSARGLSTWTPSALLEHLRARLAVEQAHLDVGILGRDLPHRAHELALANSALEVRPEAWRLRLAAASTVEKELRGAKQTKTDEAKTVGRLVAERAKAAGVERVVFDRAGFRYHGRIRSLADAAREGGGDVRAGEVAAILDPLMV